MEIVRSILLHPKIYPHIHDDNVTGCEPIDHPESHWMLVIENEPVGVFMLHPTTTSCYEIHTCLMPVIWGEKSSSAARMILHHAFSIPKCKKLITRVPAYNRAALRFAKSAGLQIEGVNRKSYLHENKLEDQIMLGITEQEWLCQCYQQ